MLSMIKTPRQGWIPPARVRHLQRVFTRRFINNQAFLVAAFFTPTAGAFLGVSHTDSSQGTQQVHPHPQRLEPIYL